VARPARRSLAGETRRIAETSCTIGREPPADIVLPDEAIEPQHARISVAPHGATVIDGGSELGTYVNDKRIRKFDLVDNDIIRIGNTRLQFKTVD